MCVSRMCVQVMKATTHLAFTKWVVPLNVSCRMFPQLLGWKPFISAVDCTIVALAFHTSQPTQVVWLMGKALLRNNFQGHYVSMEMV